MSLKCTEIIRKQISVFLGDRSHLPFTLAELSGLQWALGFFHLQKFSLQVKENHIIIHLCTHPPTHPPANYGSSQDFRNMGSQDHVKKLKS